MLHNTVSAGLLLPISCILVFILNCCHCQQPDQLPIKTDPLTIDLSHRIEPDIEFKHRGSIVVKPRAEYRFSQAYIVNQARLTDSDLDKLKSASKKGGDYQLRASLRKRVGDKVVVLKTTQTLAKACSLYLSNLADHLVVNLNPLNEFLSLNFYTEDPECLGSHFSPELDSREFNSTISIHQGSLGPQPDTASYIKLLEDERQNKLREGKEDNRSFFAKYWIYIVPAVVILMIFSGPEQGAR